MSMTPALSSKSSWSSRRHWQEARGRISELCPSGRDALHINICTLVVSPLVSGQNRADGDPIWACVHTHPWVYLHISHHHQEGKKKLTIGNNSVVRPQTSAGTNFRGNSIFKYCRNALLPEAGMQSWPSTLALQIARRLCRKPLISLCGPSWGWEELALKSVVVSGLKEHGPSGEYERSHLWAMQLTLLSPVVTCNKPQLAAQQGGQGVQGSGRCVPKQTPVLCKHLQQQESQSDHRGGEACQCKTQGTRTRGAWEGSAPSKGAGGQPWWLALCRCEDWNFPALSSIQMKPEIQMNMWNLGLWNIGNKFVFLFNNLRRKQNTSMGGSCLQDGQFCDPGPSLSSKAPGSSCNPFTSSPSPESAVAPLNGWLSTLAHWAQDSSVGPGRLAEFKVFVLNVWYQGLASGRSPKTTPTEWPDIQHNVPQPLWGAGFAGGFV